MQSGKLRRVVIFEKRTQTTDSFRNVQDNWVEDFTDRAEDQAAGGDEFHYSWKRFSESTGRLHMRFRQDIDPALHRVLLYDDRFSPPAVQILNIFPPYDPDGRMRELFIEYNEIKGTSDDAN